MATYIGIKGIEIQTIAGDPANPIVGQVWYNTTANTLKGYGAQGTGAWATGGALNTARSSIMPAGTQTAAIGAGGDYGIPAASPTWAVETETYDGSTWTEVGDLNLGRANGGGAGTQTAALVVGGYIAPPTQFKKETEIYNGTSWSEVEDLNTGNYTFGFSAYGGTTTAALIAGGSGSVPGTPPVSTTANTETYDGSTWTEVGDLNTARHAGAGGGSTTSFIYAAGTPGGTNCESYDGTSWTATSAINTSREDLGGAATSNTSALVFGGYAGSLPGTGATESWDGSSWTEVADLATGTYHVDGTGTSILALRIGGFNPGAATSTEEWSIPDATKTFTSS
jgi:hypothetical protein